MTDHDHDQEPAEGADEPLSNVGGLAFLATTGAVLYFAMPPVWHWWLANFWHNPDVSRTQIGQLILPAVLAAGVLLVAALAGAAVGAVVDRLWRAFRGGYREGRRSR